MTTKFAQKIHALVENLISLEKQGRNAEADGVRRDIRELAGHRTPSGTWRIRCVTVEQQSELSL